MHVETSYHVFQSLYTNSKYLDILQSNLDPSDFGHSIEPAMIIGSGQSNKIKIKLQTKMDREDQIKLNKKLWGTIISTMDDRTVAPSSL